MATKYNFEELEGGEYVIADPVNETADPVRLRAEWIDGDDIEGEWERAIGAVIKRDLLGGMDLKNGNGKIDRSRVVETLAAAEDEEGPIVTSEDQADALIEYFAQEGIVELDGSEVLVLQNPQDAEDVSGEMILNWAAGIEACVEKISDTQDRIRAAKEKLESRLDDMDQDPSHVEEKARETAQELKSLGDGQGVPENPSELPPEERERYDELKRKLIYHNKMMDVIDTDLTEKVRQGTNKLGDSLEQLDSAQTALSQKQGEFRTLALQEQEFPEGADNIVQNMGKLATQLAGVEGVEEAAENTDPDGVAELVDDITETVTETANTATQTAPDEELTQPSSDLEMSW